MSGFSRRRLPGDLEITVGFRPAEIAAGASSVIRAFSRSSFVHLSISSAVRRSRIRSRSSSS
ncbi:MAG TPA: hypothetical protein VG777_00015, partial [Thermoanaerobaculia bacterium]|nr:hypothetical protein [Thermoanaerobaculia bacterium]